MFFDVLFNAYPFLCNTFIVGLSMSFPLSYIEKSYNTSGNLFYLIISCILLMVSNAREMFYSLYFSSCLLVKKKKLSHANVENNFFRADFYLGS